MPERRFGREGARMSIFAILTKRMGKLDFMLFITSKVISKRINRLIAAVLHVSDDLRIFAKISEKQYLPVRLPSRVNDVVSHGYVKQEGLWWGC